MALKKRSFSLSRHRTSVALEPEFWAVLDGEAEITIGGRMQTVKAGQMLIMPANVSHALLAQTQFKMLLIMIRGN